MVYDDKISTFPDLPPLISRLSERFQADALPIVEQVRDYKDARYASMSTCRVLMISTHLL